MIIILNDNHDQWWRSWSLIISIITLIMNQVKTMTALIMPYPVEFRNVQTSVVGWVINDHTDHGDHDGDHDDGGDDGDDEPGVQTCNWRRCNDWDVPCLQRNHVGRKSEIVIVIIKLWSSRYDHPILIIKLWSSNNDHQTMISVAVDIVVIIIHIVLHPPVWYFVRLPRQFWGRIQSETPITLSLKLIGTPKLWDRDPIGTQLFVK